MVNILRDIIFDRRKTKFLLQWFFEVNRFKELQNPWNSITISIYFWTVIQKRIHVIGNNTAIYKVICMTEECNSVIAILWSGYSANTTAHTMKVCQEIRYITTVVKRTHTDLSSLAPAPFWNMKLECRNLETNYAKTLVKLSLMKGPTPKGRNKNTGILCMSWKSNKMYLSYRCQLCNNKLSIHVSFQHVCF